ncbi:hypothetical protein BVRB_037010, partial [Beta vulgaris subsp. vulgaris]
MLRSVARRYRSFVTAPAPWRSNAPASLFANYPATEVSTTSNGVRVATETLPGQTATIQVWIDAGSRYEDENNNGVAHFLE